MTERDAHVIVVGCGRVGAGLAHRLVESGRTVTIVDRSAEAFRRVEGLDVATEVGVGFDRRVLEASGADRASAVAAVTSGDNSNILVARVAREVFAVPQVLARIYDPARAAIYERLGVPTVASVHWTIEMALRRLDPDDEGVRWVDPSARVTLVERPVPADAVGRPLRELDLDGSVRVVAVRRLGVATLPTNDLVAQEGDVLYLAVSADRLADGGADA
jgi:trk system potassium uptake protein TrkA